MKKLALFTSLIFATLSAPLMAPFAFAEEPIATLQTNVEAPAVAKPWKTSLTSYYYNFEGTHGATKKLDYSFANATLNLQLVTLQYDFNPTLSLMVVGQNLDNYVETKLFGMTFKDRTQGAGDTITSLIKVLPATSNLIFVVDGGLSLPTGSITLKNKNNPDLNYAYNMQTGSGTVDGVLGATSIYIQPEFQLGSHGTAILRSNALNSQGYHLGNMYKLDAWADYPTRSGLTPRLVGYYKHKDAISGEDKTLGRSEFTEFYHHEQINWDVSAAVKYAKTFGALTLAAEVGKPLAQNSYNYDEVVVSTDMYASLGLTGNF